MWKTFLRILLSRIKRKQNNAQVYKRIEICLKCPYNSINTQDKISYKKRLLIRLSNFYSFITGKRQEDNKGNCLACEACSVYYKARELEDEDCPKGKWK